MAQLKELTTTGSFHGFPVVSNNYNSTTDRWILKLLGKLKEISKDDFSSDEKLSIIKLPNSITTINAGAFDNCTGLRELTIPSSVTSIDSTAFNNNTNLVITYEGSSWDTIYTGTLPDTVTITEEVSAIIDYNPET